MHTYFTDQWSGDEDNECFCKLLDQQKALNLISSR